MILKLKANAPVMLRAAPIWSGDMDRPPSCFRVAQKMGKSSSKAMECNDNPAYTEVLRIICEVSVSVIEGPVDVGVGATADV
jgi:hypothetical protein